MIRYLVILIYLTVLLNLFGCNNISSIPMLQPAEDEYLEESVLSNKDNSIPKRQKTLNPSISNYNSSSSGLELLKPERIVLKNGLVVYLLNNPDSPIIEMNAYVKVGSPLDPPDKAGLVSLLGDTIRRGGINGMEIAKMNRFLNYSNILILSSIDDKIGDISFSCIYNKDDRKSQGNFLKAFEIFANLIKEPELRDSKMWFQKKVMRKDLLNKQDNPYYLSNLGFSKMIYGSKHPLANFPTIKSIKKIKHQDIVSFHKKFFSPKNTILTITGNYNKETMLMRIYRYFRSWKGKDIEYPNIEDVNLKRSSAYFIEKDSPQSTIVLGHISLKAPNSDYLPLLLMNQYLGRARLSNQLFMKIRSQLGLVYYIESKLDVNPLAQGTFKIVCQTDQKKVITVIHEIIKVLRKIKEKGMTNKELEAVKNSFINSYNASLNTNQKILRYYAIHELYGFKADYLHQLERSVRNVDINDINRVISSYLHPDHLTIVVVGRKPNLQSPLLNDLIPKNKIYLMSLDKFFKD